MLNLEKENNYDISSTIIAPLSLDFVSHNFIEKQKDKGYRNNLYPSLQLVAWHHFLEIIVKWASTCKHVQV